jgi:hypothetical protein
MENQRNLVRVCGRIHTDKDLSDLPKIQTIVEFLQATQYRKPRFECKDCEYERWKAWRSKPKNRKKKNGWVMRYYYAHHEASKAKLRVYNRNYYLRNKRKLYLKQRAYAQTRRGREIKNEALRRYKAKLRGSTRTGQILTVDDWNRLLIEFDHACAWCGAPFSERRRPEQDHVRPVSKGGPHTADNVVPACRSCNARWGNKDKQFPVSRLDRGRGG